MNMLGGGALWRGDAAWSAGEMAPPTPTAPIVLDVTLSGSGIAGDTYTVAAIVSGYPAPSLSYDFKLDGVSIGAPDQNTYDSDPSDEGALTCEVTATNGEGSDSDTSNGIAISAAPAVDIYDAGASGTDFGGMDTYVGGAADTDFTGLDIYDFGEAA